MSYGAGYVAATNSGAVIVDPRPYLSGTMKTLFEDGSYTLVKDIKFKKQPAHLFEIPEGYKKFSMRQMYGGGRRGEVEEEDGGAADDVQKKMMEKMKRRAPIRMPW